MNVFTLTTYVVTKLEIAVGLIWRHHIFGALVKCQVIT